jgi:hypothetical protein
MSHLLVALPAKLTAGSANIKATNTIKAFFMFPPFTIRLKLKALPLKATTTSFH